MLESLANRKLLKNGWTGNTYKRVDPTFLNIPKEGPKIDGRINAIKKSEASNPSALSLATVAPSAFAKVA